MFNSKFTLGAIAIQVAGCALSVLGYVVDDMLGGEREAETHKYVNDAIASERQNTRRLISEELYLERQRKNSEEMS